jgi:hypothetical protein
MILIVDPAPAASPIFNADHRTSEYVCPRKRKRVAPLLLAASGKERSWHAGPPETPPSWLQRDERCPIGPADH